MRTLFASVLGLMLGLSTIAVSGAEASPDSLPAPQLLARSVNAALGATSLQFVDRTNSGSVHQLLVGTVSPATAAEQLTGTTAPLTVDLINSVVYVQTTASVLQNDLGLGAAGAKAGAGKWISVRSTDSAFSLLTQPLTITSEIQDFVPIANLRVGRVKKIGKKQVVTISGTVSKKIESGAVGDAFLVVSAKAPYLPLEGGIAIRKGTYKLNEAAAFTNWNKKVTVTPPASTTSYASLVSLG